MSSFSERLAEALIKSLSQKDLAQFYIYIKYLQVCLTSLQPLAFVILGGIIGHTIKRRKALLRKWGKWQILLVNFSIFFFLCLPVFLTMEAIIELNTSSNIIYNSLSTPILSPNRLHQIQIAIGFIQLQVYCIFMYKQLKLSKRHLQE
jgi:hypothetical protein